jgi:hypothetical protein
MVPPMRSYLPEGPFSIASAEPFQNAKLQMPASSTSNCQLSYQSYPYPPGRPSLASHISCSNQGEPFDSFQASEKLSGKCPIPDCKKGFKDLKAHMLTHSRERTEKCPIVTCDYHIKGFCRKYDKNRHTLTHFRSTIVCSFCPGRGTEVEKTFNRADVFKRHLVSVHGVEHTPPPTSRRNSSSKCTIPPIEFPERYWLGVKGKCSICSGIFADAQVFYNHLDECVINSVLRLASSSSANTSQKIEVESSTSVMDHAEKSRVSDTVHWVINKGDDYGRKRRKDYPPSWGSHADQMKIKKRVICAYDGTRRLWKDETILGSDFEANIPWSHGESYATDLDALTTKKPEVSFDEHWCKADDKFMTFEIKPKGLFIYMMLHNNPPTLIIGMCTDSPCRS